MAFTVNTPLQAQPTLIGVLQQHAATRPHALAYRFLDDPRAGLGSSITYAELDLKARRIAAYLRGHAGENDRVLLFFPPGLDYIATFLGCLYAGVVAVPLYPPRRGEKLTRVARVIQDCGARCAITPQRDSDRSGHWAAEMKDLLPPGFRLLSGEQAAEAAPMDPDACRRATTDLAFLQYTSGSTGDPKGVMVTHGNLMANQAAIAAGFATRGDDICLNWLPLYHDMGLIGTTLHPLYAGYPSHVMSPLAFIQDPLCWLEGISRERATVAGGPDFAYALCAKAAQADPARAAALDLRSWRLAFNGAEPIRARSMQGFDRAFAGAGFDRRAFYPCYGLAEATLFVSGSQPGQGFLNLPFDKSALADGRLAPAEGQAATELVACGRAAPGHEIRIVADGRELPEGAVGEIWVSGPSVAAGYWGKDDSNDAGFRARLQGRAAAGAFLRTGDLGALQQGELIVTGRLKDVLIVNGRNHYPQDIELAASSSDRALRHGCTAAFCVDAPDGPRVVVVQEVDARQARTLDVPRVVAAIRAAVAQATELAVDEVVLIQAASIPKTSSGKIRRNETRTRFLRGTLNTLAPVAPDAPARPAPASPASPASGAASALFDAAMLQALPPAVLQPFFEAALRTHIAARTSQDAAVIAPDAMLTGVGLNSIAIVQLHNALERELGIRLDLEAVFKGITLRELAASLAAAWPGRAAGAPDAGAAAAARPARLPLSHNQQQMWFLHQVDPDRQDYNVPLLIECAPALDEGALRASLAAAVARHSILRTTYAATDAGSVQIVHDSLPGAAGVDFATLATAGTEEAQLRASMQRDALRPFDLEHGPVLRARLAQWPGQRSWLLLSLPHIATDFWSLSALASEILSACAGMPAAAGPAADHRDACLAQQAYLAGDDARRDRAHWHQCIDPQAGSGLEALGGRGSGTAAPGRINFQLPAATLATLGEVARREGRTLNAVCLAAFQWVLHRRTGRERLAVGTLAAGRKLWRFEDTQGYFVNPVVLSTQTRQQDDFRSFLHRSADGLAEALAHQDYPFPLLVSELAPGARTRQHPLFQALFVMQQSQGDAALAGFAIKGAQASGRLHGLDLRAVPLQPVPPPFELVLTQAVVGDHLEVTLEYGGRQVDAAMAQALAVDWERQLAGLQLADALPPAAAVSLMVPPLAPSPLPEPSAPSARSLQDCQSLIEGFHRQVRLVPDRVAVSFGASALSYRELDQRAQRLADLLQSRRGPGDTSPVAVLLHRSHDTVVAILAVLKAGGAYLPLDPHAPPERLAMILQDARPAWVLTSSVLASLLGDLPGSPGCKTLLVDALPAAQPAGPAAPPAARRSDTAYVIFTSGSTGRPKGVQVTQGNALRLFTCCESQFGFTERDVWTLFHSFAFDFSVWEMWGALLYGGRLVVVPYEVTRSPAEFHALLEAEQVTVLNQTPSAFAHLVRADLEQPRRLSSLRTVVFGGEALSFAMLKPWFAKYGDAHPRLVNMYGITETTVHVTWRAVRVDDVEQSVSLIGSPLPDLCIELLDEALRPVADGQVGEIFVAGEGVSAGYLGQPALTAERFLELELTPGSRQRYYRSGDLARRRPDGDLEFHGRADQQICIDGFRIEPREIESAVLRFAGIAACVVATRLPAPPRGRIVAALQRQAGALSGIRQLLRSEPPAPEAASTRPVLAAYIVCDVAPDLAALHEHLSHYLPDYMMPAMVLTVPAIPLNHNGKTDMAALQAASRELRAPLRAGQARCNALEQRFADLYAEVLGRSHVGPHDGFFELGGDSIRIIQLRSRALKAGLDVSVQDIFRLQTPAALAAATQGGGGAAAERARLLPFAQLDARERSRMPADVVDAYPLARLQEGLLFHSLYGDAIAMYCDIFEFRLRAPYDEQAFREAAQALVDRHPIFRTSFHFAEYERPLQLVHEAADVPLQTFDRRGLPPDEQQSRYQGWLEAEKRRPYDVARAPLLRFSLHRMGEDEFVFTMSFHDALLDGWSESSTVSELLANYFQLLRHGGLAPATEVQTSFSDFVALEQESLSDPQVRRYWEAELEDLRPTRLPAWSDAVPADASGMVFHAAELPPSLSDQLQALARRLGVSVKHVLLAAHAAVVSLVCGESDIVMAVESNGRLEDGDGERVLGTHLNVVPWRVTLGNPTWEQLIRELHAKEAGLQPYRRLPYQAIQGLKGNVPLFDISFNYTHFHVYEELERLAPLRILDAKAYIHTHFALRVEFNQDPFTRHLTLDIEANLGAVPVERVQAVGRYFTRALQAIAEAPGAAFGAACLLGPDEMEGQLAQASGRVTVSPEAMPALYTACLEQAAAVHADRPAARDGRRGLSYRELMRQSRLAASNLRRQGVARGDVVALWAERSVDLLAAMIGAWRLGASFVPLPDGPAERVDQILARAAATQLLHADSHQRLVQSLVSRRPCIALSSLAQDDPDADTLVDAPLQPDDLAYMIFTSGSTGEPKGVMIEHGGMINHMLAKIEDLSIDAADQVSQDAALTFDICVWQFCAPLLAGAQVRIFEDDIAKDPSRLLERVVAERVSILEVSPSVLSTMLVVQAAQTGTHRDTLARSALRWIVSSGETLQPSLVRQLREAHPAIGILNMWGATETSDDCTHHAVPFEGLEGAEKISIGRPIANAAVHVLDAWRRVVPAGTPGELYVAGICVGRGYVNDPDRTAASFLPAPWTFATSDRLYRSGDRGWRAADGTLYFIGRRDAQVKIRGHRIEIGEVEAVLNRQAVVQEAAVLALPDAHGQLSLAAWIVPADAAALADEAARAAWTAQLRRLVRQALPAYMVPDTIVLQEVLPRNVNGKVDRKALSMPEPAAPSADDTSLLRPRNRTEHEVLELFAEVLKRDRLGIDVSFFEAGGNSLLATQLVSRARRRYGLELPIRSLFENDTVIAFSRCLQGAADSDGRDAEIVPVVPRPQRVPLSFNQARLWFLDRFEGARQAYGSHFALRIEGALDVAVLAAALQGLVDRHEILRTWFASDEETPHQVIEARMELPLRHVDLTALEGPAREAALASGIESALAGAFRLDRLPLCEVQLFRLSSREHVLLWRNHHIVGDGWSAGVMMREIEAVYGARLAGAAPALPPLPIQFADYAIWQREHVQSGRFRQKLDFWKAYLAGHSGELDLPTDHERPQHMSFEGRRLAVEVPPPLTAAVRSLCARSGVTLYSFLQCALGLLLSRYCKHNDLLLGTVVANRQRIETEPLIGFLTNTLPVRLRFDPAASFAQHLGRVHGELLDVFEHQDVPFEHLVQTVVKGRNANVNPLVQVMFVLQNEDLSVPRIEGLRIEPMALDRRASILDLLFDLQEREGRVAGEIEFNVHLFHEATVRRLWQHLLHLVEAVVAGPELPLSQLSTLGADDRRRLEDLWRTLQQGPSGIAYWSETAPQTPQWEEYLQRAESQGVLLSAYMAVSEYP